MSGRFYDRNRRRLWAGVILGLVALVVIAVVVDPGPARTRRFIAMNHSHERGVVRTIAPYLGIVGEIVLRRDCGKCHDVPAPRTLALSRPAAEHPRHARSAMSEETR